jgi:hypothetical protein
VIAAWEGCAFAGRIRLHDRADRLAKVAQQRFFRREAMRPGKAQNGRQEQRGNDPLDR